MTVFKGYLLVIKRNLPQMLLYFGIFMVLAVMISSFQTQGSSTEFTAEKLKVAVVDLDNTSLSQGLKEYIGKQHEVVDSNGDQAGLQEDMYYGNITYVVTIPKNFRQLCLEENQKLQVTKQPGSYSGSYADQSINDYINGMKTYEAAGFSEGEAVQLLLENADTPVEVTLLAQNENGGELPRYYYYLRFLPYAILGALGYGVGYVVQEFTNKERKNRIACAAVSQTFQNLMMACALLIVGLIMWLVCFIFPGSFGADFFTSGHLPLYGLNIAMFILCGISVSFLIGMISKTSAGINGLTNIVSLGLCFLGGIFVDVDVMGDFSRQIAQFLPTYWYEQICRILGTYSDVPQQLMATVGRGILIQALFALACLGAGLVISKCSNTGK